MDLKLSFKVITLTFMVFLLVSIAVNPGFAAVMPDPNLTPHFDSIELETGFFPDPHEVEIVAGGDVGLADLGFVGYVAENPDVNLMYEAGSQYPLIISVVPAEDLNDDELILLVNTPDGDWYYDWHHNRYPVLELVNPISGTYNIWVGGLREFYPDIFLRISEIEPYDTSEFDLSVDSGSSGFLDMLAANPAERQEPLISEAGDSDAPDNQENISGSAAEGESDIDTDFARLPTSDCSGFSHDIVRPSGQTAGNSSGDGTLNQEALDYLRLGMSVQELVHIFCEPVRVDPTPYGYEWYIYSRDYYNYFQVGVRDEEVVMIYTNSPNWTFKDYHIGMSLAELLEITTVEGFFDIVASDRSTPVNSVREYENGDIDIVFQPFALRSNEYDTFVHFFNDINDNDIITSMLIGDADSTIATGTYGSHYIGEEDYLNPYQITSAEREAVEVANGYQVFDLLNAVRVREGLEPLNWHDDLSKVARAHSEDMAENDFTAHDSPTTGSPLDRIQAAGIEYDSYGENLAFRTNNSIFAHELLMNSPTGHRETRLRSHYTHIGAGVYLDNYYTEKFLYLANY